MVDGNGIRRGARIGGVVLAALLALTGCQISPDVAHRLNDDAGRTAQENVQTGVPDAEVSCWQTTPTGAVLWLVPSHAWVASGSCDAVIVDGRWGILCTADGVCRVLA